MDLFALFGIFMVVVILGVFTLIDHRESLQQQQGKKLLLILDLNGVLVYRDKESRMDHKRDNVDVFLDWCFEHFDVALWSSARKHNVERLAQLVMGEQRMKRLVFMWHQDQCTPHATEENIFKKPLQKVWDIYPHQYDQTNTFIIDDSKSKMEDNPSHTWIEVKSWKGSSKDDEEETLKQLEERLWKLLK